MFGLDTATFALLAALAVFVLALAVVMFKDIFAHKDSWESGPWYITAIIGFITDFLDTLGIGSFAPTTSALKFTKYCEDELIPGTLNVAHAIPVAYEAFLFIQKVEVDSVTLIGMIAAATVGAWLGAGVVAKLSRYKIQIVMGIALAATALIMIAQKFGLIGGAGEATGVTGAMLIVAVVGNFILGALMTAGVGLYAPCMALVGLIGMNVGAAFPIMMGSCAFLMQVAGIRFVREGKYVRKGSLFITIFGCIGVWFAVTVVTSLPMEMLKWLVIGVIFYTAFAMITSAQKTKAAGGN